MLESLYNIFGFAGSLLVSFLLFMFFVFWMAGVAGICLADRPLSKQIVFLVLAVLVPIYPVLWLIMDMWSQRKQLQQL